jgi:hypothetical protein
MKNHIITILLLVGTSLQAQDTDSESKKSLNIGLGIGIDYGGIGVRTTFLPVERLGLFASLGYNLNATGFNAGAQWRFPEKRHAFFITGMYGYNAVLIVAAEIKDKATYYGITLGGGYQLKVGPKGNFFNWEILVPFRNSNFHDDYKTLQKLGANPGEFLPIAISFGFHFKT